MYRASRGCLPDYISLSEEVRTQERGRKAPAQRPTEEILRYRDIQTGSCVRDLEYMSSDPSKIHSERMQLFIQ